MHDTYTPTQPDHADCPTCALSQAGAAVVGTMLRRAYLDCACAACAQLWSEVRDVTGNHRYWTPPNGPPRLTRKSRNASRSRAS